MRSLDKAAFTYLLVLLWNLWNVHDNAVMRGLSTVPHLILAQAREINEACCADNLIHASMLPLRMREVQWSQPIQGVFKVNVDVAWDPAS